MTRSAIAAAAVTALLPLGLMAGPASGADQPTQQTERRAAAYKVSARINADTAVAREDVVKVKGRVKPKAAGEKVVLQQRMDGKKRWKKSGTAKIRKNGTYVLKDDPSTIGTRFYRVVKPASDGLKKGMSKELELVVYGWEALAWRAPGPVTNMAFGHVLVGTDSFGSSISSATAGEPSSVEYTLGDKCTSLRATYALTDASASGATGTVTLSVDGAVKVNEALAIGTIKEVVTDVTDAFRIRYDFVGTATPAAYPAAADAEVLCTR